MMSDMIWDCECGQKANSGKFCINCGKKKPEEDNVVPVEAVVAEPLPVRPVEAPAYVPAPAPVPQYQQPYGYAAAPQNTGYVNASVPPVQQKTSSASLILGIFSLICICIQPLGALLAVIGLITSRKGGTGGKVTCILGLIFGLLFLVIDLFVAYMIMTAK